MAQSQQQLLSQLPSVDSLLLDDKIVALLNDDSNEVGQVHLGVVHLWTLDSEDVTRKEQMITQMGFSTLEELHQLRDTMETWSQLCLDGLEKMYK